MKNLSGNKFERAIGTFIRECIKLKMHETTLIIADLKSITPATALLNYTLTLTNNAYLIQIPELQKPGFLSPILRMLSEIDVLIIACDMDFRYLESLNQQIDHNSRIIYFPYFNQSIRKKSIHVNYNKLKLMSNRLADIFSIGKNLELKSDGGTLLQLSIKKENGITLDGKMNEKGIFSIFPSGKAQVCPVSNSTNGTVVVDGSIQGVGQITEEIKLNFRNGRLVRIFGNGQADLLRKFLKNKPFSTARDLIRIGVGTNHNAKVSGNPYEDEVAYGRIHLGIGQFSQSSRRSNLLNYFRITLRKAELSIDGRPVISNGKMMV